MRHNVILLEKGWLAITKKQGLVQLFKKEILGNSYLIKHDFKIKTLVTKAP